MLSYPRNNKLKTWYPIKCSDLFGSLTSYEGRAVAELCVFYSEAYNIPLLIIVWFIARFFFGYDLGFWYAIGWFATNAGIARYRANKLLRLGHEQFIANREKAARDFFATANRNKGYM